MSHLRKLKDEISPFENNKRVSSESDFNDEIFAMLNQLRFDMNNINERVVELNLKMVTDLQN